MIKISAPTIELALLEAGKKLGCQCIDLEYEIVEKPSGGFLGFGKKDAVIVASIKADSAPNSQNLNKKVLCEAPENSPASWCKKSGEASSSGKADFLLEADKRGSPPKSEKAAAFWRIGGAGRGVQPFLRKESSELSGEGGAESSVDSANNIDSTQNLKTTPQDEFTQNSALISKIQSELNALFSLLPIELNTIEVSARDKNTISIYFTGKDAALLIGEKGYRYKALSYLLYNWLNTEYGVNMRLEIESFLANQEAMISAYLAPIIETLKTSNEPFTTKPFDGILAYIALKELRAKLKGKSIILQSNDYDENCIIITPLKSAH